MESSSVSQNLSTRHRIDRRLSAFLLVSLQNRHLISLNLWSLSTGGGLPATHWYWFGHTGDHSDHQQFATLLDTRCSCDGPLIGIVQMMGRFSIVSFGGRRDSVYFFCGRWYRLKTTNHWHFEFWLALIMIMAYPQRERLFVQDNPWNLWDYCWSWMRDQCLFYSQFLTVAGCFPTTLWYCD